MAVGAACLSVLGKCAGARREVLKSHMPADGNKGENTECERDPCKPFHASLSLNEP